MKYISALLALFLILSQLTCNATISFAAEADSENTVDSEDALSLAAPSAILMEADTGTILYEKNPHERLRPASVTKIMTLLLIFEALDNGQIHSDDTVTVSEHASEMGGSQVYLEAGETQTVNDLIKCISIASANDAAVAMAEYIDGSEDAFVAHMNEKAKKLNMNDTTFVNCCGLEADGHLTSAHDIALMSRELSNNHPQIHDYCTVWMDHITHTTRKGTSDFGLTNTNKLLRQYSDCTGLKTGYTSQSGFCLSATATRDHINLIAVVMAEENSKIRNKEAVSLLDYGFTHCQVYSDPLDSKLPDLVVSRGKQDSIGLAYASPFQYVITDGSSSEEITKELHIPDSLEAPVKKGDTIGCIEFHIGKRLLGSVDIIAKETVPAATLADCYLDCFLMLLLK